MNKNIEDLITEAVLGNAEALEKVLLNVQDSVFNLSLRMLGAVSDAEDATQDILVRIMTNLASFRGESQFQTWVYRVSTNYLIDYKKSMFAQRPLDFDFYSHDIKAGYIEPTNDLLMGMSEDILAEELKLSCTNVMLQCFDPQTRCIFILGTMFKVDSRIAGEILNMTPENYRQKLSRAKKKMASFLTEYCGLSGTGGCSCKKRVGYAIQQHRIHPKRIEYINLKKCDKKTLLDYMTEMENIDEIATVFADLPAYHSTEITKDFIEKLLRSPEMKRIQGYE